ncbi:YidC/Oxa1 family membrane protein insertase [Herbiconiux sp. CPCC 203407]|uniref:Membrane protein insertase YidC n=1 Tax=Herbiconiux oxytropis TaxID=2970915 RepID=A0AA42BWB4_9MICO|nr:YidC/Oxa1 family membrane protein insertase [Herbiconiux oxytropis]MCS5723262.1 YidC/Oxa1 family membrane protein insertase [Herbiconiux oxytropis]MCS5727804.1 YidC/Oxa1 family membrane protein insertase [Herbiconiux oxytropis]
MNIYAFGPIAALLDAASAVVRALSDLIEPFAGASASALAIVLITLLVRSALIPVGLSQSRAARMRRRLAPRLALLRSRHGSNPERLQRETMALYAEENASPLAGCLPLLIQAPVLTIIYGLFLVPTINGHANLLLADTLAGAPLGTSFASALETALTAIATGAGAGAATAGAATAGLTLLVAGLLLALIAVVALLSRRLTLRIQAADATGVTPSATTPPALAALAPGGSAARLLSWLPLITVIFAAFVPLAATLYLLVTTAWTLVERTILHRVIV